MDVTELLEYKCRLLAIAGRVVRWIHRIYDSKLRFVLLCHWKRVEGLVVYSVNTELAWVK